MSAPALARGGCGSNGPLSILDPQTEAVTMSPSPAPAGSTVRGTVTMTRAVDRDMFVFLQINDNAVSGLPFCVTLRAGQASASFSFLTNANFPLPRLITLFTTTVDGFLQYQARENLTIVAPSGAPAPPPPPPPPPPAPSGEKVVVNRAEWTASSRQLRVEATTTNAAATLTAFAYDGTTETRLGTLSGGRGQFTTGNPNVVVVRSSSGAVGSRAVTVK